MNHFRCGTLTHLSVIILSKVDEIIEDILSLRIPCSAPLVILPDLIIKEIS